MTPKKAKINSMTPKKDKNKFVTPQKSKKKFMTPKKVGKILTQKSCIFILGVFSPKYQFMWKMLNKNPQYIVLLVNFNQKPRSHDELFLRYGRILKKGAYIFFAFSLILATLYWILMKSKYRYPKKACFLLQIEYKTIFLRYVVREFVRYENHPFSWSRDFFELSVTLCR